MSRRPRELVLAGAALAASALATAAALSACKDDEVAPYVSTRDGGAAIKIGLSVSLSGANKGVGTALRDGAETAVNHINARGGVLDQRRIELIVKDDQSNNVASGDNGAILRDIIEGFRRDGVTAILGPGASVQLHEAQAIAFPRDDQGVPVPGTSPTLLLSAWSTSPSITQAQRPWPERFLYRTAPSDVFQTKAMFKLMSEGPVTSATGDGGATDAGAAEGTVHRCRAPFLVYSDDIIGQAYFAYLPRAFATLGVTVTSTKIPTDAVGDYGPQINQIIQARPDCIAFGAYLGGVGAMLPALRSAIRATPDFPADYYLVGNDALYDTQGLADLSRTSPGLFDGMVGVVPDTNPPSSQFAEFKALFQLHKGTASPPQYASNSFDAAVLVLLAIQKAGAGFTDPTRLRDALVDVSRGYPGGKTKEASAAAKLIGPGSLDEAISILQNGGSIDYFGASGPVNFDDAGDVKGNYVKWLVRAGTYSTIASYTDDQLKSLPE